VYPGKAQTLAAERFETVCSWMYLASVCRVSR
jgi:hypothetical protein